MAINLAIVKLKHTAIYALALLLIYGCAAGPTTQEVHSLNDRLARVERSLDESGTRVEELESKLILIREKLNRSEGGAQGFDAREMTPPEGLKVIRLGEGTLIVKEPAVKSEEPVLKAKGLVLTEKGPLEKSPGPTAEDAPKRVWGRALTTEPPEAIYKKGQDLFLSGRYGDARSLFAELARAYPESSLADNAFFWSGEAFYSEKNFPKAIEQFEVVLKKYPRGNKVPDSLLKMGLAYKALGEGEKAAEALKRLVKEYPRSEAARIASKRLKSL